MSASSRLDSWSPARDLVRDSLRRHAPDLFEEEDHRPYPGGRHRKPEPVEPGPVPSEHARPLPRLTGEEPTRVLTSPPVPSDRLPARAPQAALRAAVEAPAGRTGLLGRALRALRSVR